MKIKTCNLNQKISNRLYLKNNSIYSAMPYPSGGALVINEKGERVYLYPDEFTIVKIRMTRGDF